METKSNIDANQLERVARAWVGTPFLAHGNMINVGVDCVHLVAEIYRRIGVISEFSPPSYTIDGGNHSQNSPVDEYLSGTGKFRKMANALPDHELEPGDLLTFRVGRMPFHCGLHLGKLRFVHAMQPQGVIESTLRDPTYWRRLTGVWRPL